MDEMIVLGFFSMWANVKYDKLMFGADMLFIVLKLNSFHCKKSQNT